MKIVVLTFLKAKHYLSRFNSYSFYIFTEIVIKLETCLLRLPSVYDLRQVLVMCFWQQIIQ